MIFQNCENLTPSLLTHLLIQTSHLQSGQVLKINCTDDAFNKGYVSNIARAHLTYSSDAKGILPSSVFLKLSKPDLHTELQTAGKHEVIFYQAMQKDTSGVPIPFVYSAEVDETNRTHILMQDLTETHFQKPLPIPPSNRHCEQIVEALAKLHAHWWNSQRLDGDLGTRYTQEEADATHQRLYNSFPKFVDFLGDALLPQQRRTYEKILESNLLQQLTERLIQQHNVSLIHGDVHTGNVMLPQQPTDQVTLIDWHRWSIDVPTFDLAFMIALHWSPTRRMILEKPLIQRYYHTLVESGVTNYTWEQCWDDYRIEVIITMLIPIGQHRRGSPLGVIWFGLQDSWAAVHDLNCIDLIS